MVFDEEHKNKIAKLLAIQIATSLRDNKLTIDENERVSTFILDNIHTIKTHEELIAFLDSLTKQWPIFESVLKIEKGEVTEEDVKKQAEELTQNIKDNNLN